MSHAEFVFHQRLAQRLDEDYDARVKTVIGANKIPPKTFEDYRYELGVLEGLRLARQIAKDVEAELIGRPSRQ